MKNKSTLAKLLSEEDIFVVHKKMETAYFNPKSRELGLPIWKDEDMTDDIYDLMVGHEIGHAIWSPLDLVERSNIRGLNHSFVNIIEDVRIEKKSKEKYPGLVSVFKRGYVDLVNRDFFGTSKKDISKFCLIDRINIFFKSGDNSIPFSEIELPWVKKVAKCKTPDDVLTLAEELYKFMEENPETMAEPDDDGAETGNSTETTESGPNNSDESNPNDDSTDSDSGMETKESEENGDFEDEDSTSSTTDNNSETEKSDEGSDKNADTDKSDEGGDENADTDIDIDNNNDSTKGGVNSSGGGKTPKATTDNAFGKALENLVDKDAKNRAYGNVPKVDSTEWIINYKKVVSTLTTFYNDQAKAVEVNGVLHKNNKFFDFTLKETIALKKDSKKIVSYMVKEFEMKKSADQYARATTSKTGTLDMSKLHTYKYNEDLFKKVTTLPGATNHGLVMVVDWSGSMAENLKTTVEQLFNLVWFCRRIKIPFEVFAFSDGFCGWGTSDDDELKKFSTGLQAFKAGDIELHKMCLMNLFSSNMSIEDENKMVHYLYMMTERYARGRNWRESGYPYSIPNLLSLGGTPLNDAILLMMDYVPKFVKNTGVQKVHTIFLTDGASNSLSGVFDYKPITEEDGSVKHEESKDCNFGSSYNTKTIINDPRMNKKYETEKLSEITDTLLKALKNRVPEMNVIGFFIAGSGRKGRIDKRTLYHILGVVDDDAIKLAMTKLRKDKVLVVVQKGYDEYYILPGGNALVVENETLSDELVGAGKGKLKAAFGKMQKGKINSRVLLNKFTKLIA